MLVHHPGATFTAAPSLRSQTPSSYIYDPSVLCQGQTARGHAALTSLVVP